jgi:hypothetical protein
VSIGIGWSCLNSGGPIWFDVGTSAAYQFYLGSWSVSVATARKQHATRVIRGYSLRSEWQYGSIGR